MTYAGPVAYGEYYIGDIPPYGWWQYPPTYPVYPAYNNGGIGWECPKCHHIYSPYQDTCGTCNANADLDNMLKEDKEKEDA